MSIPVVLLENRKIPRVILSIPIEGASLREEGSNLLREAYVLGFTHFDLPTSQHLEAFRAWRALSEDENLTGWFRLDAKMGVSFLGRPLHSFESKLIATLGKSLSAELSRRLLPTVSTAEVFTQKEIDRFAFDRSRFEGALSALRPEETPFLIIGERYGDWLLALGRIDLLQEMTHVARERNFVPIFSGQWPAFSLPKAKPLDVAAYAVPIRQKEVASQGSHTAELIKRFDKPLIALNPLRSRRIWNNPTLAFRFLFEELKIYAAFPEPASSEEVRKILEGLASIPSFIPPRRA